MKTHFQAVYNGRQPKICHVELKGAEQPAMDAQNARYGGGMEDTRVKACLWTPGTQHRLSGGLGAAQGTKAGNSWTERPSLGQTGASCTICCRNLLTPRVGIGLICLAWGVGVGPRALTLIRAHLDGFSALSRQISCECILGSRLLYTTCTGWRHGLLTNAVADDIRMTHAGADVALAPCLAAWGPIRDMGPIRSGHGGRCGLGLHALELCWCQAVPVGGVGAALKGPDLQHVCQRQQLLLLSLRLTTCKWICL